MFNHIVQQQHQINLRHVKSKCHYDGPWSREAELRGERETPTEVFTCSQNLQTLFTTLENLEKVAGGTLHTYERKLYPHNKAESRERRRLKQVWGPILSQS